MIRYTISREALEARIEATKEGWLARAAERTETFRVAERYAERSSIWSEVKSVYMELQGHGKCAYCERKLEAIALGRREQDVEHFRPKGDIGRWNVPEALQAKDIQVTPPPDPTEGYYLLAYHPLNYAASCKPCNSGLKGDRFPIAGSYSAGGEDPVALLQTEQPYLIYPIGDFDTPPEDLIAFYGLSPKPRVAQGHARKRALVTIAFFRLDDVERKNLLRERATVIIALFPQLERLRRDDMSNTDKVQSEEVVIAYTSLAAPHTNCARSFKRLFEADPVEAKALFDRSVNFIVSVS